MNGKLELITGTGSLGALCARGRRLRKDEANKAQAHIGLWFLDLIL